MNTSLDPQKAAEIFIDKFIIQVFDNSYDAMISLLKNGPPGRKPHKQCLNLHRWYKSIDEDDQLRVIQVINQTMHITLFELLVLLDDVDIYSPLEDRLSDLALYIQTYVDKEAMDKDTPQERIRLNPEFRDYDLHDIFQDKVWERLGLDT